jgi:transglutaminase-like putative cysteine protease
MVPIREHPQGVAPGSGDLRLRPRSHNVQLRARQRDQNSLVRPYLTARRVPGFRLPRGHVVPLHEHPGALLRRLPWRHRRAARPLPMDFSAWFEVYLGNRWYTFDARHNKPRIGRILMARGRDATDVAIVTSFGPCTLAGFKVITEEVTSAFPASP